MTVHHVPGAALVTQQVLLGGRRRVVTVVITEVNNLKGRNPVMWKAIAAGKGRCIIDTIHYYNKFSDMAPIAPTDIYRVKPVFGGRNSAFLHKTDEV